MCALMSGNFFVCVFLFVTMAQQALVEYMCWCVPKFVGFLFFSFFFFFTMAPQAGALTRGEEKQGRVRKEGGEME